MPLSIGLASTFLDRYIGACSRKTTRYVPCQEWGTVASLSKHDWIDKQLRICMDQNNYGSNTSSVQKQNILQQGTVSRGNNSSTV